MNIKVWRYCQLIAEINVPSAPGPDLSIDPWQSLIMTVEDPVLNKVHKYHEGEFDKI